MLGIGVRRLQINCHQFNDRIHVEIALNTKAGRVCKYVGRREALRRVGFEETDLFDIGHAPYRWDTYTEKRIYPIYERNI